MKIKTYYLSINLSTFFQKITGIYYLINLINTYTCKSPVNATYANASLFIDIRIYMLLIPSQQNEIIP